MADLEKYRNYKVKDFLVSGEEFSLVPNETYGFLETCPQPSKEDLPSYYESESYISHTDSKKGLLSFLYQQVKQYSLRKKVGLIKRLNGDAARLLDIGAGTGDFLKQAKQAGWKVTGVEPSQGARSLAKEKGLELFEMLESLPNEKYEVITLWHVLEHLPDLEASLERIYSLLAPNGHLVIAVPNFSSWDATHYRSHWAAFDVPRHLWHFSQDAMRAIISPDLDLVETLPMRFDSYYVSLLSEKYKSGSKFSLKAIWAGWRSNWSARRTSEYSSLIYCFKKQN
ncbi:MAG: class I SAM-dependent methyltransferase [Bacteroidota bacterium]